MIMVTLLWPRRSVQDRSGRDSNAGRRAQQGRRLSDVNSEMGVNAADLKLYRTRSDKGLSDRVSLLIGRRMGCAACLIPATAAFRKRGNTLRLPSWFGRAALPLPHKKGQEKASGPSASGHYHCANLNRTPAISSTQPLSTPA